MTDDKIPTESYLALVDSARDKTKALIEARKLLQALMLIDAIAPEQHVHGMSDYALRGLILHMGSIARAAVADFEGDKQ